MTIEPGVAMLAAIRLCVSLAPIVALLGRPLASQEPAAGPQSAAARRAVTAEFIASQIARAQTYFVVLYTVGPTPRTDREDVAATQQKHLEYLFNLRRAGLLTAQGPVFQGPAVEGNELRGVGFLVGVGEGKARELAAADPHVKAGYLRAHVVRWMGLPGDSLPHLGRTVAGSPPKSVAGPAGRTAVTPEFIAGEIARAQTYILRLYTLGPAPRADAQHVAATQQRHQEYLFGLRRAGLLTLAGPVLDGPRVEGSELRGIGILVGVDEDRAREVAADDPHVKAGYLKAHVYRWMGLPGDSLPLVGRAKPPSPR